MSAAPDPIIGMSPSSAAPASLPPQQETLLKAKLRAENLNFFYGEEQALFDVSLDIPEKRITALIGSSGCGKSTFLRTLNRINETTRNARYQGRVLLDGHDVLEMDVMELRRRVGMVFQKPNPFPKSVFENVAFGVRLNGLASGKPALSERVEYGLRRADLWDELKDKLDRSAYLLPAGQQQRLCIARALALDPEVLLLDEPCSTLDPVATAQIEDLLFRLKDECTQVIVTHNMQQAARVAEYTGFFLEGRMIEFAKTDVLFRRPERQETEDYITGRFG